MAQNSKLPPNEIIQPPLPLKYVHGDAAALHRQIEITRHKNRVARARASRDKAARTVRILTTKRPNIAAMLRKDGGADNG
ncbi:hypothetical protein [Paremcibacter congregatus]|uniref:hypothetical protein n=1 Tax=Paremcibacter congregatus TaxID=2043170 RepID=UPI0030EF45B1